MHQTLRDWIVAKLLTVPNIGSVHSYQRYADREKALADLYTSNNRLHGWYIKRVETVEKVLNASHNIEKSTWLIRGYLAINDADASELEMDSLLDDIQAAFRSNANNPWQVIGSEYVSVLFNEQPTTEQIGFSLTEQQPVLFAGVLCHSVTGQLILSRNIKI